MLLVVNAGSSSVKTSLFDGLHQVRRGQVGEIGPGGHRAALEVLLAQGMAQGMTAAAHRVVHGGARLTMPTRLSAEVLAEIEACIPLAPLHNPANLTAIRALIELAPDLPQYASFDTGFHATNPPVALRYAVPPQVEALGLRRYGFHGLSYAALVRRLPEVAGYLPERLLAMHLGNGASLCAILGGRSVATTMGYSPLDGLTMGTRAGGIDGNAVLRLAEVYGIAEASRILNRDSGLLGLGGSSDMRALQADGSDEAQFARDHFTYWAVRHAGSMIAAMGGLDGIVFTGGIGENDAGIRAAILQGLAFMQPTRPHWVIEADEERQIAVEAMTLMHGSPA
ncbi:MAG: acetate kinase [Candidatus Saccharibacteria bacterium]|nr:acetate kinase [Pseudorhodobacter sp.]